MLNDEEIIKRRKKRKKIVLIAIGAAAGIFLLFGLVTLILSGVDSVMKNRNIDAVDKASTSGNRSYIYPEAKYDYNIFEDNFYMNQTDRSVRVTDGVVTTVISEDNYDMYSPEIQFMYGVIELIIKGDYVGYNKIFTDDYIKNAGNDLRERFTMQQLFELELEIVNYEESAAEALCDVRVSYRIRNNNGTFRNDLDYNDDGALPVVYKLVCNLDKTEIKVDGLLTYYKYMSGLY